MTRRAGRHPRRQVRGRRARARRPGLRRRPPRARACCTPRCASPTTPAPTCVRHRRRRARARRLASWPCSPPPTSRASCASGSIHKDWPVLIPEGGRTSYLGDVLAVVVAETRQQARAAAALVDGRLRRAAPAHRPGRGRSTIPRSRCGAPTATCSASASTPAATSTPRSRPAPTWCTRCSRRSASSTPSSSPSRRSPCPSSPTAAPARLLGRPGRVGRPQRHRPRCSASTADADHRRAGVQRRRVRRQGGHGQPGADGAGGLAAAAPGEVHAVARGEPADPPEAPPDPHRVLGRLRRRGQAHRRCGCASSATRAPYASVGMKVLERAAGHASGPVPPAGHRRARRRRPHQQPGRAARSGASAPTRPSSPWRACSTGSPSRSASAAGRCASAT